MHFIGGVFTALVFGGTSFVFVFVLFIFVAVATFVFPVESDTLIVSVRIQNRNTKRVTVAVQLWGRQTHERTFVSERMMMTTMATRHSC